MFVIFGIVIVVIGSVMMIYLIPPLPLQITFETGFITSEEAKSIVHESGAESTKFVFLKYIIPENGLCKVMMYPSDPYSKKIIGSGQEINLPCFPFGFQIKKEGFAWTVVSSPEARNCSPPIDFVDAKNGEYIGRLGSFCMERFPP
jgi:hypothetical protein